MDVIKVNNLSKTFTAYKKEPGLVGSLKSLIKREKIYTQAVKSISFNIKEGELVGFLGPNGAGKTTTLKMLSGILYPTAGEAKVLGFIPWQRKKEYQKQFAIVMGQKNQLWWDLPAQESFLLNKAIYEVGDKVYQETIYELISLLEVEHLIDVPVRKLSLGERMKMELIAALLHRPKVLFLDEPTIGLDVVSQAKMRDFIKRYNQQKKTTILLTSHYMEDVEQLCQRVIIITRGEIIYDGNLKNLIDRYVDHKVVTVTFTKEVNKNDLVGWGRVREFESRRVVLEIADDKVKTNVAELLTKLPVDDILIDEVEVEEVIRKIFAQG